MPSVIRTHRKVSAARVIRVEDTHSVSAHIFPDFSEVSDDENLLPLDAIDEEAVQPDEEEALYTLEEVQVEVQGAYDRGFSDGKQVASALYDTEMNKLREWVKNLDTAMMELREQYSQQIESLESVAVQLAMTATEHILGQEIHENTQLAVHQVKKAIAEIHGIRDIRVRIHPSSFEALTDAKSSLVEGSGSVQSIEIISDPAVESGGCILETAIGTVDAQFRTQMRLVRAAMEEASQVKDLSDEF